MFRIVTRGISYQTVVTNQLETITSTTERMDDKLQRKMIQYQNSGELIYLVVMLDPISRSIAQYNAAGPTTFHFSADQQTDKLSL